MLTIERAREINDSAVTEHHLIIHAKNVMYAMGAMADHFGEDREHWMAVGYLHDYDYEKYPEEHLDHTEADHHGAFEEYAGSGIHYGSFTARRRIHMGRNDI